MFTSTDIVAQLNQTVCFSFGYRISKEYSENIVLKNSQGKEYLVNLFD